MPDWSYHPLKSLMLNHMSPQKSRSFIHKSMSLIASLPFGRQLIQFLGHTKPPVELSHTISDIVYPAPIGLSGAIDPLLQGTKGFQYLGFGFVEIGPIVMKQPDMSSSPMIKNDQIFYSVNSEKTSLKHVLNLVSTTPKIVPWLATIDCFATQEEVDDIISQLASYVDGFVIPAQLHASIPHTNTIKPFFLSVFADKYDLDLIRQHVLYERLTGIVVQAPLTQDVHYVAELREGAPRLTPAIMDIKEKLPHLVVISSGGVHEPSDALKIKEAGADLLIVGDGFVTSGPGIVKRSYELMLYDESSTKAQTAKWSLLFALALFIGGLLALIFALNGVILPYDEHFIGLTKEQIYFVNPHLLYFMVHDRIAYAGTTISASIIYFQLARHGLRQYLHWSKIAFHSSAIMGFLCFFLFIGYGYFDWLHRLFWVVLLIVYVLSVKEGIRAKHFPTSPYGHNDRSWRLANFGQLMFVILGVALIIGGIVISAIGITKVFISTDIAYLCMSAEIINELNDKLIPVIAHDRVGFGSVLITIGLLVFMIALWGYRRGEQWVWNTLTIGAIPAFATGIGTHFYIGYTTFIHLLPVYILVVLYMAGLVLSYSYLKHK